MPYNGTVFTLICTIKVHKNVDTTVDVSGVWTKGAALLADSSYMSISQATPTENNTHETTLTFNPLRNESFDTGNYTCSANVTSPSPYITSNSSSSNIHLSVVGKLRRIIVHVHYNLI